MNTLFYPDGSLAYDNHRTVITTERAGWDFSGLRVLRLDPGESQVVELGEYEGAVLPLSGSYKVSVDGDLFELAGREHVWAGPTDFVFAGLGSSLEITAVSGGDVAVVMAKARVKHPAAYQPIEAITVEVRGGGRVTRQINNFMSAAEFEGADRLIAVEVITPAGNVSSYPPHKHDELTDDEVPLEEIYYFKVRGENAFSLFGLYSDDRDVDMTEVIRDGDVVLCPKGYHGPAVALPGYDLYYLNVMAGPSEERVWKFCTDPAHEWQLTEIEATEPDPRLPYTHPEPVGTEEAPGE